MFTRLHFVTLQGKLYIPGTRQAALGSPEALKGLILLYTDPKLDGAGAATVPPELNRLVMAKSLLVSAFLVAWWLLRHLLRFSVPNASS